MASGIQVNDECKAKYQEVKMKMKKSKKLKFAVFKISDDLKQIEPDCCLDCLLDDEEEEHLEQAFFEQGPDELKAHKGCKSDGVIDGRFFQLLKGLPENDGRYVLFDYNFKSHTGADTSKLIMVMWCPDNLPVKKKMLYAASKDALKKYMPDCAAEFHFSCRDEKEEDVSKDIVQKLDRK